MSEQLINKVAIITGAGQGIGRAIALTFAREGAHVTVADKSPQLADETCEVIRRMGRQAFAITTDVTQEEMIGNMVQQTLEAFGTIDILVANASIQRRYFVTDLPRAEFQAMLDVNLLGMFLCCQAILPILFAQQQGNIILVASDSGKRGYAYNAAYCASQFAVIGFMEALADEVRTHGIRVNALCPAGVKTDMSKDLREADGTLVNDTHFMEPNEIADVALFLASHQSRAIHGQTINVYGGVDNQLTKR